MRLIRLLLPKEQAEAFEGDLREDAARGSHLREIVYMAVHAAGPWLALAVGIGVVPRLALGPFVRGDANAFLPYLMIVLFCIALFRWRAPQTYFLCFVTALVAFMTYFAMHYTGLRATEAVIAISIWGHTWRVAFMLAIACVVSAAAAVLTRKHHSSPYPVSFALALLWYGALIVVNRLPTVATLPYAGRMVVILTMTTIGVIAIVRTFFAPRPPRSLDSRSG